MLNLILRLRKQKKVNLYLIQRVEIQFNQLQFYKVFLLIFWKINIILYTILFDMSFIYYTNFLILLQQVAWLKVSTATVLSFNDILITRNNRISVKKEEGEKNVRNWKLVINDVKEKDKGMYMCQLNTDPTEAQTVYLEVTSK